MDANSIAYNDIAQKLAHKYSSQTTGSSTFTVVVQPGNISEFETSLRSGLTGFNVTEWGEIFLSDLDCFHPNSLADEAFTIAIWNNMFTAPGDASP